MKGNHHEPGGNFDCFQRRGGLSRPRFGRARGAAASRGGVPARRALDRGPQLSGDRGAVRVRQPRRLRQGRGGDRGLVRGDVRPVHWSGISDLARAGPRRGRRSDRGGALLAGIEGALAGTALGSLAGALVGWGVPKDRALEYEKQIKGGKFLVIVRSNPEVVARARSLLAAPGPDHIDVYEPPA